MWLKKLALVGSAVVVALLILELALRLAGHLYLSRYYSQTGLDEGARSPAAINVLAIGESTTVGIWAERKDSYPKQLESLLRAHYGNDHINVVYPPHIGRNTSQMANRIGKYIEVYRPRVVIFMVGANNPWSFSESHIGKFLAPQEGNTKDGLKIMIVKALLQLDHLRVFKVVRHAYLAVAARNDPNYREQMAQDRTGLLGHPDAELWPPRSLTKFLLRYSSLKEPLKELLRYDVGLMIDAARDAHSHVILMTYPVADSVPLPQLIAIAEQHNIPLIRNDLSFTEILANKELIDNYFFSDHWHPNGRGYSFIARNVFTYIRDNDLAGLGKEPRERPYFVR